MANGKRIVLQPTYMKEFKCIGGACEDSCCVGWRVDLDKETYLTYKKIQDEELKPLFDKKVNRKHNQKSDESYGNIKMNRDGRCPFLDENNLCMIQKKLGAEYLSDTCKFYPRIVNRVDGKYERSATMSCPEVARLALLNKEGIVFEQYEEEDEENRIKVHSVFDTEGHLYINKPQRYFWEIRLFSLALLQNRKYTLDERLILLGIVYKKLNELKENGNTKDIPQLLEIYNQMIENGDFKEQIEKVPTNLQIQMRIAKELVDIRVALGLNNQRYLECLKETLLGLGYVDEFDINEVVNKYNEGNEKYLKPYLKEKEYILENYLVNEYFKELMPFGKFKTMWDSYIFLCLLYSIVKLHLIGMANVHQGLKDENVLKLIQSISKLILHSNTFIQRIVKIIKDSNVDSLAYMAILVKS